MALPPPPVLLRQWLHDPHAITAGFTVVKLLLYRHALRRYALPPWEKYALNQLIYVGDEFQNAITASHDGTSDFNVIDRIRDCMLMLIVSAQAFESLIPPQTKEQAEVLALNLKNLFMYRAASETDALRCANALGKHYVERSSRTTGADPKSLRCSSTGFARRRGFGRCATRRRHPANQGHRAVARAGDSPSWR